MLTYFLLVFFLIVVGVPVVNFFINFIDQKKLGLVVFGAVTTVVVGSIFYGVFLVEPVVPKVRYSKDAIPVRLCGSMLDQMMILESIREDTVPQCEIEWLYAEGACGCQPAGKHDVPYHFVEWVESPTDENRGFTPRVAGSQKWIDEDGKEVTVGELKGGCTRSTQNLKSMRHELVHICGYHHAIGNAVTKNVRGHVMSRDTDSIGDDTRGLDVDHDALYTPFIE